MAIFILDPWDWSDAVMLVGVEERRWVHQVCNLCKPWRPWGRCRDRECEWPFIMDVREQLESVFCPHEKCCSRCERISKGASSGVVEDSGLME